MQEVAFEEFPVWVIYMSLRVQYNSRDVMMAAKLSPVSIHHGLIEELEIYKAHTVFEAFALFG
jgi:hypothetical protein